MTLKVKLITGYREDQYRIIDSEEAHKAYFIFLNPEQRTVFKGGVAMIGKDIKGIEPAYNETMGWNPKHKMDEADWNEVRNKGVQKRLDLRLEVARLVAQDAVNDARLLALPLSVIAKQESSRLLGSVSKQLTDKFNAKNV